MQRRKLMRLMAMLMQEAQGQKALMQEAHGHKALMQAQWQKALMQEQGQKALGQKALMQEAHGHTTIHGQEALIHGQEALINGALMQADVALMQANGQHGTVMQADGGHRQNRALMQADGALMQEPLMQADGTLVSTVIGNSLIECISWRMRSTTFGHCSNRSGAPCQSWQTMSRAPLMPRADQLISRAPLI